MLRRGFAGQGAVGSLGLGAWGSGLTGFVRWCQGTFMWRPKHVAWSAAVGGSAMAAADGHGGLWGLWGLAPWPPAGRGNTAADVASLACTHLRWGA